MKQPTYVSQKDLPRYRKENTPAICPLLGHVDLIPVVDHDHRTGRIRGVVSSEGNALLGKIENFYRTRCVNGEWNLSQVLRAMADYLEQEQGPLHPAGTRQRTKRFTNSIKEEQLRMMRELEIPEEEIASCKNKHERTKLYRKWLIAT